MRPEKPRQPIPDATPARMRPIRRCLENQAGFVRMMGGYGTTEMRLLREPDWDRRCLVEWCVAKGYLGPGPYHNTYAATDKGIAALGSYVEWEAAVAGWREAARAWDQEVKKTRAA